MPEKSCLNCAYGKPKKQLEGYYCGGEGSLYQHSYLIPGFYEDMNACASSYKSRLTRCETDGCKWFGKYEGKDFCYYDDDHWVGAICEDFNREKEAEMQIEFHQKGKAYGHTDKKLTLRCLFKDAEGCPDAAKSIHRFWHEFFDPGRDFNPSLIPFTANQRSGLVHDSKLHIPWLIEKGYLREVVEEETYKVGQWFKNPHDNHLIVIVGAQGMHYNYGFFDITANTFYGGDKSLQKILYHIRSCPSSFTPIPPPTITEQPEPAERRPKKCVHNHPRTESFPSRYCTNPNLRTGRYCEESNHRDCPEYREE